MKVRESGEEGRMERRVKEKKDRTRELWIAAARPFTSSYFPNFSLFILVPHSMTNPCYDSRLYY